MPEFQYNNTETKYENGQTVVRKVSIRGGKGHKSVSIHSRKKRVGTAKRQLTEDEIKKIRERHFIPRLFADCKVHNKSCRKYPLAGSRKTTLKRTPVEVMRDTPDILSTPFV
jgi:hypothetical protein